MGEEIFASKKEKKGKKKHPIGGLNLSAVVRKCLSGYKMKESLDSSSCLSHGKALDNYIRTQLIKTLLDTFPCR